jgi:integrase
VSVQRHRDAWRVRWRENGRQHSRSFARRGDAILFDSEVKRRLALGPHLMRELDRSAITLDAFVRGGFRAHAATLAAPTRAKYGWALENHLAELLDEPLVALDVPTLATHQRRMLDAGATPGTVRDVMTRLSGVLQVAVEHGHIPANPVRSLRKVPAAPRDEVRALAPVDLERLIAGLSGRDRAIALLAGHLGLRPLEVRAAPWSAFDGSTLVVGRARTKRTAARTRVVDVPAVTTRELRAWQLESGGRGDEPIVGPMSPNAMKLWGRRVLPAGLRLYELRHAHASALHHVEGFTVHGAARRLGHAPALHLDVYAHVLEGLPAKRYADLDALIASARAELECPQSAPAADEHWSPR